MLSMAPKKALPKARKRQLLSSGMIRRTRVELCVGRGSSGGSRDEVVGLRARDRGLLGLLDFLVMSSAEDLLVPVEACEGEVGIVLFDDCDCMAAFCMWDVDVLVLDVWGGGANFSLTISCSPSSLIPRSLSCVVARYWSKSRGFGG